MWSQKGMERKEFCLIQIKHQGRLVSQRKHIFITEDRLDVKHVKNTNISSPMYCIVSIVYWLLD